MQCLMPLVNVPMIEYTLEFLAKEGVQQIFIVSCSHASIIEEYLNQSIWMKKSSKLKVQIVRAEHAFSVGDALRQVDSLGEIQGDFVLISGDVISNIKLEQVLKAHKYDSYSSIHPFISLHSQKNNQLPLHHHNISSHNCLITLSLFLAHTPHTHTHTHTYTHIPFPRARVQEDKHNIMTIVMKKATPSHRTRSLDDELVVVLDEQNNRIMYFDDSQEQRSVSINIANFEEHPRIQFRHDLLDCHIDICTPEVRAPVWSDAS